ncbi:MAG: protein kinase [Vicinamibacteria bacterium]
MNEDDAGLAERTLSVWSATLSLASADVSPEQTLKAPPATVDGSTTGSPTARILETLPVRTAIIAAPQGAPVDYVIRRELGRGGMGVVYEADQRSLGRSVAVKMMLAGEATPEHEARFIGEARATGRLEHPNIVPVYDLGRTSDARVYLGMKLVRGESWKALLRREPPTTPESLRRALEILAAICDAVGFAHAHGIVHRDLKPENVMLGQFGEVQVMDWGLALDVSPGSDARARESGPAGTPAYMSPEQARGDAPALGTWSDVYLLGAMLYEVLTGSPPHRGQGLVGTLVAAARGDVVPPAERAPARTIPRELAALCLSALDKDPSRRPTSAQGFKDRLRNYLAHAEAMRLLERTRELLAGPEPAEALPRAQALLDQARELWPESEEAEELLGRLGEARADLALERGDGRAARRIAEGLAPGPGLAAERIAQLRAAARRQERRGRNQLVAAAVLAVSAVLGTLSVEHARPAREAAARARDARGRLGTVTEAAWKELRQGRDLDGLARELGVVARTAEEGGLDAGDPALGLAAGWRALRVGEPRRVPSLLTPAVGDPLRRALESPRLAADPLAAADEWLFAARALPAEARALGEATILVAGDRLAPPAAIERVGPALAARLAASGAQAVLADARSGLPHERLGLPLRIEVRPGARPGGPATLFPRETARVVAGLDPLDRRERWRFPPPLYADVASPDPSPLLVPHEGGWLVLVAWGADVIGLDPATGVPRTRLRTQARVAALLPSGEAGVFLIAQGSTWGAARSRLVRATAVRALEPLVPAFDYDASLARRASRALIGEAEPRRGVEPARVELARVDVARRLDPTSPLLDRHVAERALVAGRPDEARAAASRLAQADLSAAEFAEAADALDQAGLAAQAVDALAEQAVLAHARSAANPDLNPLLSGNPVRSLRRVARRAGERGDGARRDRLAALAREVATAAEGDALAAPLERRWLERNGRAALLQAFEPYESRARKMGGLFMTPPALVDGVEPAAFVLVVVPFLLLATVLVLHFRVRAARTADLRALGFRSWGSQTLAFVTNPVLRLSHTFVAYASRAERAVLLLGAAAAMVALVHLEGVARALGEVATVPADVGHGQLGTASGLDFVLAMRDRVAPARRAPHDRLLAEAWLQRGEDARAREALDAVLALAPGDPFASNNEGVLLEKAGRRDDALAFYRRAASAPGDAGAIARANVARFEGAPRPALPVAYRAWQRLDPGLDEPLRQLADPDDLLAVLDVLRSPWAAIGAGLSAHLAGAADTAPDTLTRGVALFSSFGLQDGGPAWTEPLERVVRSGFPLFFAFVLLHVPFTPRRLSAPTPPRVERALCVIGSLADVALPGARWLARRRIAAGALLLFAGPFLFFLAVSWLRGSTVLMIALPPIVFVYADPSDARTAAGIFTTGLARTLGPYAEPALFLLYGSTWALAVRRLVLWGRERRRARSAG